MNNKALNHSPPRRRTSSAGLAGLRSLLSLLLLLGPLHAAYAADDALDAILAALGQHTHGEVHFSEETYSRLLARPAHSEGVLRFDAPDRLEKQTLVPRAEDLIAEGDVVTSLHGRHRTSIRLSQYPQLSALLDGIRATLGGNRASLEQHFQVALVSGTGQWELRLTPLAGTTAGGFARIVLRGHADALEYVALEQANGDHTTMVLTSVPKG